MAANDFPDLLHSSQNFAGNADNAARQEQNNFETYRELFLQEEAENLRSYRQLREDFARKIFRIAVAILIFWSCISAFLIVGNFFKISLMTEKQYIACTAGCTIYVFAAFITVVKGVFQLQGK
ncbi:MAG: hypothetical protein J6M05_06825 [Cardiobacteriaceae bacterium]|nr:hypothetical protein [Cardiobacteriaceae bacterium]